MATDKEDLVQSFDDWFATILAIVKKPIPKQNLAKNTGLVSGYDLNGLDKLVKDLLAAHMAASNEHNLTLKQLGTLSTQEVYNLLINYQNGYSIPLTSMPNLASKVSVDWITRKLTVTNPGSIVLLGKAVVLPTMTVTMPNVVDQIVSLVVSGNYNSRTFTLEALAAPVVTVNKVPFLKVNLASKTVAGRELVRIGLHELSTTRLGTGIPVSTGNQSRSGTISTQWYGG